MRCSMFWDTRLVTTFQQGEYHNADNELAYNLEKLIDFDIIQEMAAGSKFSRKMASSIIFEGI